MSNPKGPRIPTPATPIRGVAVGRAVTERGSVQHTDHAQYGPRRREESWDEDKTPPHIPDPETYRAVRELKKQTAAQDVHIGTIKTEVTNIKETLVDLRGDVKALNNSLVRVATIVEEDRDKVTITETQMVARQTASTTTKETLADRVLEIDSAARKFRHTLWLKIAGGVFSGAVLVAAITTLAERC